MCLHAFVWLEMGKKGILKIYKIYDVFNKGSLNKALGYYISRVDSPTFINHLPLKTNLDHL